MEGTIGSIWPQAEINGKTQKLVNVCDIVRKVLWKNTQKAMLEFVTV
jgi:hypothetical protein